jgi:hypothetical protein
MSRSGFNPHVAGLSDLGGDEAHRLLNQVDQCGVRRAVRIVDELVERHSRVLFETERAAVGKTDPDVESLRVWTTSPWNTRSPTFRSTATPLRVTVADPLTVSTRPIGCCAAGAAA